MTVPIKSVLSKQNVPQVGYDNSNMRIQNMRWIQLKDDVDHFENHPCIFVICFGTCVYESDLRQWHKKYLKADEHM